jgi:hypothetical protein
MVRRLDLIPLRALPASGIDEGRPQAEVGIEATLLDALNAVLASDEGRVAVVDNGRVVNVLDADKIRALSR